MIQKKISMIGAHAVGKTSLVRRFVTSIFSEKYLTTVGVKIDKKIVKTDADDCTLVIWDLAGEDDYTDLKLKYLRGSSGYLLVADGTREATFKKALELQKKTEEALGALPFILAINKTDLENEWMLSGDEVEGLKSAGWKVILTSAKSGSGVEESFQLLAQNMLNR